MFPITAHQLQRIDRALRLLYVHSNREDFPAHLLESVRGLIGSEITCYSELDPAALQALNIADPSSEVLDSLLPVFGELQAQHPRLAHFGETGITEARSVSNYLGKAAWHKRDLYQHFYGALGLEDQLSIMVPAQGGVMIGLALNRTDRSFTEDDHMLLNVLQPHMSQAWSNAQAVSKLEGLTHAPQHGPDSTIVRLKDDGSLWFMPPRAHGLLRHYFHESPPGEALPERVRLWIQEHLGPRESSALAPRRYMRRVRGRDGCLGLSLIPGGKLEGWLLLLHEQRPRRVAGTLQATLPPRLQRVLDCMLSGASEKQMAARLELSANTVHEYVKQIYRYLGVSSRSELMARWVVRDRGEQAGPPA